MADEREAVKAGDTFYRVHDGWGFRPEVMSVTVARVTSQSAFVKDSNVAFRWSSRLYLSELETCGRTPNEALRQYIERKQKEAHMATALAAKAEELLTEEARK